MNENTKKLFHLAWNEPRRFFFYLMALAIFGVAAMYAMSVLTVEPAGSSLHKAALIVFAIFILTAFFSVLLFVLAWIPAIRCLLTWILQRRFFALVCVLTLVALFYAVENWRGRHAWQSFRKAEEARGEIFDLLKLAPPPVPDEQNFAMADIWMRDITLQIGRERARRWYGDGVDLVNTNAPRPLEMSVDLSVLDLTNGAGNFQKGIKTDLAAWQNYYRQLAEKTNFFPVPATPSAPADDILISLSRYDKTIEELRRAASLPYSRFPLIYDDPNPMSILLPHLAPLKTVVRTLQLRAIAELGAGKEDEALDDVELMLRVLNANHDEPLAIAPLVQISELHLILQPIWEGLVAHQWKESHLAKLEAELSKLDFLSDSTHSMRGERAFAITGIDYWEQHRQEMGGLMETKDYTSALSFEDVCNDAFGQIWPRGWFDQNKLSIARTYGDLLLPVIEPQNHRVFLARQRELSRVLDTPFPHPVYDWFSRVFIPALQGFSRKAARAESLVDLARVAIALERYHLAHGNFPQTLDALAPQFLAKVPHDLITGEPLKYSIAPDGNYSLYSVGWNERDDGGKIVLGKGKAPSIDIVQGDWVWFSAAQEGTATR